ncbi:MAG TPA: cupin domain-containing protein [Solirubrobacteraceae bacterium]
MSAGDLAIVHARMAERGRSWWGPGDMYTFLVTGAESGGTMFALDCLCGVGGGPPVHRHLAEDELFSITAGSISFKAGELELELTAGESIFVPRGMAHSYTNKGPEQARMVAVYTPAGMEGWFREVYQEVEDPSGPPPPVTEEMLRAMHEAGPRYSIDWME